MTIPIPETNFLALANDRASSRCVQRKRLDYDWEHFSQVPEIATLKHDSVVFDIGAYIGDTAILFLSYCPRVYAFEPNPDAFACLVHNCPAAISHNLALGSHGQQVIKGWYDGGAGNIGGLAYKLDPAGEVVAALDDFTDQINRCDLLKIDCEGFEPHILDGGRARFIAKHLPPIYIEITPKILRRQGFDGNAIHQRLEPIGYIGRQVRKNDWIFSATTK